MDMLKFLFFFLVVYNKINIISINRIIYLTDKYPIEWITYKIKNKSKDSPNSIRVYFRKNLIKNLKHVKIYNKEFNPLKFKEKNCKNELCYDIYFDKNLKENDIFDFQIKNIYEGIFEFLPNKIKLNEKQLVYFKDFIFNNLRVSPKLYTLILKTNKKPENIQSIFKENKSLRKKNEMTFTYETQNLKKIKNKKFYIHTEINMPFEKLFEVEKSIDLSHFGYIQLQEKFNITNNCAGLDGEFNRNDEQDPTEESNIIYYLNNNLPKSTYNLNLKDENGNVTTSKIIENKNDISFLIKPRFYLLGQWNSTFFVEYNINSNDYLSYSKSNNLFKFSYPFSYSMKDVWAEKYILKINLPELSKLKKIEIPYVFEKKYEKIDYQILDLFGKKQLVFEFKNIIPEYFKDNITIYYEYNNSYNLFKIIYCSLFVAFITTIIILFNKMNLDFKKDK